MARAVVLRSVGVAVLFVVMSTPPVAPLLGTLPPTVITLFLFLLGWAGWPVGAAVHGLAFALANLRLRRPRVARWPSLVGLGILMALDLAFWADGAFRFGLKYQGRAVTIVYAVLNALAAAALVAAFAWIARKKDPHPRTLLNIHFAAHAALLTVLLPYLGETP
jgi:hypothetical protein